jgi:hypothetical protein
MPNWPEKYKITISVEPVGELKGDVLRLGMKILRESIMAPYLLSGSRTVYETFTAGGMRMLASGDEQ